MDLKILALTCISLIWSISLNAQSTTIDSNAANPQRTRVLNTRGLDAPPTQILWKSEKLFHYRASEWITAKNGPFRFKHRVPDRSGLYCAHHRG